LIWFASGHQIVQAAETWRHRCRNLAYLLCCSRLLNLWKMRNDRIFNNKLATSGQLLRQVTEDITLRSSLIKAASNRSNGPWATKLAG
jgi:hypothetical protein